MRTSSSPVSSALLGVFLTVAGFAASPLAHGEELFADHFETTTSNWTNVAVGIKNDWTRDSGGTPSYSTGPSSGSKGTSYYMYFETSSGSAYYAGDTAILESPEITHANIYLVFQYHMYGSDIGGLVVDVLTDGGWIEKVWAINGQQHTKSTELYATAEVDLGSYNVSRIRIRAIAAGGYRGDIAIDNIQIFGDPPAQVAPTFNEDPLAKGDAIQDQPYSASIADDAGDLNGDALFFSKVSGPDWLSVDADGSLSGTPAEADVGLNSFVVEVSDGDLASTAVVQITVQDDSTPVVLSFTDFESGMGDWSNAASGDTDDWRVDSGGTPSSGTGPLGGGNGSTYYAYLETSYGYAYYAGDTAILEGPDVSGTNLLMTFQYHLYGSDIGTLAVDILVDGSWLDSFWSVTGQEQTSNGAAYTDVELDLGGYSVSKVRFRAIADGGYRGDMAIDNVQLLSVPAAPEEPEPPTPPEEPEVPVAPMFLSDPISKSTAVANLPYSDSLAGDATDDNGDALTFDKVSGPFWLSVAADGTLSGTPDTNDVGVNNFVVSVSDGSFVTTATLEIFVDGSAIQAIANAAVTGHGQDGGGSGNWVVDGVVDAFWLRTAYQEHVSVSRYISLDYTKRSQYFGVMEFRLPQVLIDNAANVIVDYATLELDVEGGATGTLYVHGYPGNGTLEAADFSHNNLVTTKSLGPQRVSIDVTPFVAASVGQGEHLGFLFKPWDFDGEMYVKFWNGTPHPVYGPISGQQARIFIHYRVQ